MKPTIFNLNPGRNAAPGEERMDKRRSEASRQAVGESKGQEVKQWH